MGLYTIDNRKWEATKPLSGVLVAPGDKMKGYDGISRQESFDEVIKESIQLLKGDKKGYGVAKLLKLGDNSDISAAMMLTFPSNPPSKKTPPRPSRRQINN